MVVRPMVTYGAIAWYTKASQVKCTSTLNSLQRLACTIITGAIKSTPTASMEAMLNLTPLGTFIEREAHRTMYRLTILGDNKWLSKGFVKLQNQILNDPILGMPSDSMKSHLNFKRNFAVKFPTRDEWISGKAQKTLGDIVLYTDGSKHSNKVGAGVYGEKPRLGISTSLGTLSTVFQAEMYAVIESVQLCLDRSYQHRHIDILSDSQAVLKALLSVEINSKTTLNGLEALNTLGMNNRVTLSWVPGHSNVEGNEKADSLAKLGANLTRMGPEPFLGVPRCTANGVFNAWTTSTSLKNWSGTTGQEHSKCLIEGFSHNSAQRILGLSKPYIRAITRILTGHCRLSHHLHKMGLTESGLCRFCMEEPETPMHILCTCGPLFPTRNRIFGRHIMSSQEVRQLTPQKILLLFKETGIVDEL